MSRPATGFTVSKRSLAAAAAALVLIQLALTYLTTFSAVRWGPMDLMLATIFGGVVFRYRLPLSRAYPWLAGTALTVLLLYGLALRVFPVFFGRSFSGRYDLLLAGNLVDLLFDSGPPVVGALLLVGVAAVLLGLVALLAWLIASLASGLSTMTSRSFGVVVCMGGVVLALATLGGFDGRILLASELFDELAEAHGLLNGQNELDAAIEARRIQLESVPSDLARIREQSVFLFAVESYGEAIWKAPSYRALFEPFRREAEASLETAGFQIASRLIRSPVKGGGSWFAHSTILTGHSCDNTIVYERLLESRLAPLPSYFRRSGHHTVSALPAVDIPKEDWPDGRYFRFDEQFWFHDFDYTGPRFGWSPIPDQFAIQSFHERVVAREPDRPLFVDFTLTSSHSPFRWVPPYVDGHPSTAELEAAYRKRRPTEYDNSYHRLVQPAEGYTDSIRYSLQSVIDYAVHAPLDDAIFIVVGDHQPMATLEGTESNLVPLHVFSRDHAMVQRFVDDNFGPGLLPKRSRMRMEELLPLLLRMFSL